MDLSVGNGSGPDAGIYCSPNLLSSSALPAPPLPPGMKAPAPSDSRSSSASSWMRSDSTDPSYGTQHRQLPQQHMASLSLRDDLDDGNLSGATNSPDPVAREGAGSPGPGFWINGGRRPESQRPTRIAVSHKGAAPTFEARSVRQGGWLSEVNPSRETSGLPSKTGTGLPTTCTPLQSSCCVPPPWDEPMLEESRYLLHNMMLHDRRRVTNPESVMNEVVYDSVDLSPFSSAGAEAEATGDEAQLGQTDGSFAPYYVPRGTEDDTLVFESRFESGNLRRAIKVYDNEYDLILRPDINTKGHTQWFYFSVANTRRSNKIKFNIINLMKEDSLYSDGMQPLVHSAKESVAAGHGWHRKGENIAYYQNSIRRKNGKYYYTLTFTMSFPHDNDVVHIAHCYPYTYSDLQRYLDSLQADPGVKYRMKRRPLCQTLAGNSCDLLTITNFSDASPEAIAKRKGIVITGRVHPGETNASWMMKGVLDFLTGNSVDARLLRSQYVFKIVPMLNPDGVIHGNYRCSLAGVDLNRVWMEPSRKLHPTICNTKMMIKKLMEDREVVLFCDLHGHSRKKDIFLYGCTKTTKEIPPSYPGSAIPGSVGAYKDVPVRFQEKLLPCMLHHNLPDIFSFASSNFKVQKSKESTARIVCWRELGLVNSFTLEASFAGASTGNYKGLHFNTTHLEEMGRVLCTTLLDYASPDSTFVCDVLHDLEAIHQAKAAGFNVLDEGVDDEDKPTDSDDDSDEGDTRRRPEPSKLEQQASYYTGEDASLQLVPDKFTSSSSSKEKKKPKKSSRARQTAKELMQLSKEGDVAAQAMIRDVFPQFQETTSQEQEQQLQQEGQQRGFTPGFLEDSGATGLGTVPSQGALASSSCGTDSMRLPPARPSPTEVGLQEVSQPTLRGSAGGTQTSGSFQARRQGVPQGWRASGSAQGFAEARAAATDITNGAAEAPRIPDSGFGRPSTVHVMTEMGQVISPSPANSNIAGDGSAVSRAYMRASGMRK